MWISKADKKLLLDLIKSKNPFNILNLECQKKLKIDLLEQNELTFIWQDKPKGEIPLPEMIYVSSGKTRDFLAWASTYLVPFRPITSFCRVLDRSSIKMILDGKQETSLNELESACIGVLIGESITHLLNKDIKKLFPAAVMSTYSYSMARTQALGLICEGHEQVSIRWQKARNLTKQSNRILSVEKIRDIWTVLTVLNRKNKFQNSNLPYSENISIICDACRSLIKDNSINSKTWAILTNKLPKLKNVNFQMRDSREQRVRLFEECAITLSEQLKIDKTTTSFLFGYLASQIATGSIKYVNLLQPYLERFPGIIVWYGLCAGLYQKTDVQNYNMGLGWRIIRNLLQDESVYQRPRGDIALDELEVLLSVDRPDTNFHTENHPYLFIEMLPMVYTVIVWTPSSAEGQLELFKAEAKLEKNQNLLTELGQKLTQAQELYNKYLKILP